MEQAKYNSPITTLPDNKLTPTSLLNTEKNDIKFCSTLHQNGDYILNKQDEVKIAVLDEQSLSGKFTINSKGKITMPLIGDVGIEGCSASQAKQIITDRYADGYLLNPNISIEIIGYKPIYVIGEVRSPGEFKYAPDMTVLKAVALAGGFTYRANKKSMPILRNNKNGINAQKIYSPDDEVMPGDIITIKERLF